jgi:hypothetical protein
MGRNHNNSSRSSFGDTAERFLEMGIGMALAGQMTGMANRTMTETMQPPSIKNPAGGQQRLYYAVLDGRQAGPFSETEIVRLINEKRIVKETLVWHQGMTQWKAAQDIPEILRVIVLEPPPLKNTYKDNNHED